MTGRVFLGVAACLVALGVVTGTSALLAWSGERSVAEEPARPRRVAAALQGRGVASGTITRASLHAAHVAGSEPVACTACHEVERNGFAAPAREQCLACHPEREAAVHAGVADVEAQECTSCHDFADHGPLGERAWRCAACHERPHDLDPPMMAGVAGTCANCHSAHGEASRSPSACIGCHEAQTTGHHTTQDPGTGSCLACHRHDRHPRNLRKRHHGVSLGPLVPVEVYVRVNPGRLHAHHRATPA